MSQYEGLTVLTNGFYTWPTDLIRKTDRISKKKKVKALRLGKADARFHSDRGVQICERWTTLSKIRKKSLFCCSKSWPDHYFHKIHGWQNAEEHFTLKAWHVFHCLLVYWQVLKTISLGDELLIPEQRTQIKRNVSLLSTKMQIHRNAINFWRSFFNNIPNNDFRGILARGFRSF